MLDRPTTSHGCFSGRGAEVADNLIGQQPRVAPEPGVPPVAGPLIGTNPYIHEVSPHSDPFGSGMLGSSAAPLLNRSPHPGGYYSSGGGIGGESSPLDLDAVHGAVSDAQAGASGDPIKAADDFARDRIQQHEERQPYPGAADPPSQGVYNVGGRLTHIRMTGPSTGGSTGRYGVATDLGDA